MGMFTNYQAELLKTYQPNNLTNAFPISLNNSRLYSSDASKPLEEYDSKGTHIGYFWRQGETLNLEFSIEGEITVEPDAFVHTDAGDTPYGMRADRAGQKYYNIVDMRSWQCYLDGSKTVWVEDIEFTYPESGVGLRYIYMPANEYIKDKDVVVTLYNFRMEPVHTWSFHAPQKNTTTIVCEIDKQLSSSLAKGIYSCSVVVEGQDVRFTAFDSSDCKLLVK